MRQSRPPDPTDLDGIFPELGVDGVVGFLRDAMPPERS